MRAQHVRDIAGGGDSARLGARFETRRIESHQAHGVLLRGRFAGGRFLEEPLHLGVGVLVERRPHEPGQELGSGHALRGGELREALVLIGGNGGQKTRGGSHGDKILRWCW